MYGILSIFWVFPSPMTSLTQTHCNHIPPPNIRGLSETKGSSMKSPGAQARCIIRLFLQTLKAWVELKLEKEAKKYHIIILIQILNILLYAWMMWCLIIEVIIRFQLVNAKMAFEQYVSASLFFIPTYMLLIWQSKRAYLLKNSRRSVMPTIFSRSN